MFLPFSPLPNRTVNRRQRATRKLYGVGELVIVAVVVCCGGWLLFQQTVHSQLRDRVQAKISDALSGTGLRARLGQARFHEGKGIQLNDLQLDLATAESAGLHSQLEIYEAFIHAPQTMTQLVASELKLLAVEIRRAKLTVVRKPDGQWDFQQIISSLAGLKSDSPVPISLTDCEIRIVDQSNSPVAPITLSNVNLYAQQIVHEGRVLMQLNGGFQSPAISQIEFTTFLDQQTQSWRAEIGAIDASLSRDLIAVLPPAARAELKELRSVSGKINFNAMAMGRMSFDVLPSISIEGNVDRLTIDDMRLPLSIRNVSANFEINNSGFAVSGARGNLGLADFSGNYWQHGFLERQQWHCDGNLTQFNFDHSPRLSQWLPEYCKKFCAEYSPSGTSNIKFDLTHDGRELKRHIVGDLTNMSFSYINLPYRIDNCVGRVNWLGDVCDFNVRSFSAKEAIELKGVAKGIGQDPTYEINISVPGDLPIDQKMHDAVSVLPKLAEVLDAFNPTGRVGGIGKIEKRSPQGKASKTFDVRLKRCSIRHDSFDYPIHNVEGLIHVENDNYTFSDLSGNNSSGKVNCNGNWDPDNGLFARFLCESIPLNDQLRFALKPELREIWNGFRPRGTLDFMRIDMKLPINATEVDLNVKAWMEKSQDETAANYISIHPVWFPYEINHLTGTVDIGNGEIWLKDCEGKHQRTKVFCQGKGIYSDDDWSVSLKNLLVTSLKVDEDLLAAVPRDLAPPIRQLKYQGLLGVNGEVTIAGSSGNQPPIQSTTQVASHQASNLASGDFGSRIPASIPVYQPATNSLSWDVRFDMTQAKMLIGVPVENVFGNVRLAGFYDGNLTECRGDLDIDSMTIYDAQITNIQGPIWLDNFRVAAGSFCPSEYGNTTTNISPIEDQNRNMESVTGQFHNGAVTFDANMNSGGNNEYKLFATLKNGCLSTVCREYGNQTDNIDGDIKAEVELNGDYTGIHSQRGKGYIELSDAKIYELPVFLSLLKILNIRQLTRTAFDSGIIMFDVEGENIDLSYMEFLGDAISLIGNGRMNLDFEIDLNFYSVMGRNRFNVPVLSELYHASSQKILWINVDGTLGNPQTHRHVLPQLNDSIRQLFEPRGKPVFSNRLDSSITRSANRSNQRDAQPITPVPIRR